LNVAGEFEDWTFAVPEPPLLIEPLKQRLRENISYFQYFPVCECFAAFDAAISFTGDTIFELAHFGVPPIIVPKTVLTGEDHARKARSVVGDGRGFIVPENDTGALVAALDALRDDRRRREISEQLTAAYGNGDGAANAADTLIPWVARDS
jgi:UDP:flavonoid glycosyltransferase YjiC (YdhE family)